jgi:hypothetical protein
MSDFREADALRDRSIDINNRLKDIDRLLRPPTEEERVQLLNEMEALKREYACVEEAYKLESMFLDIAMNGEDDLIEEFEQKKRAFTAKWGIKEYAAVGWGTIESVRKREQRNQKDEEEV